MIKTLEEILIIKLAISADHEPGNAVRQSLY